MDGSTHGQEGLAHALLCFTSYTGFSPLRCSILPNFPPIPHCPPSSFVASLWISHTEKLGLISIMQDLFSILWSEQALRWPPKQVVTATSRDPSVHPAPRAPDVHIDLDHFLGLDLSSVWGAALWSHDLHVIGIIWTELKCNMLIKVYLHLNWYQIFGEKEEFRILQLCLSGFSE